ncbi:ATP--guanido phosphotransferase [Leptospira brenneri]|uniref:ATP--guanido phosphotransferase n=1 Tax=Leptospira brenneri TaxID=2023182 RepID=A0A2M9XYZ0_9LEPT|nr:ATP--guanido phosphotransferase [Leptospira brenneri]PJZ44373.1 ATP--guanido phosphotransferase [Leptospira brenneri]TGK95367.1 ATP--guanido phosphotransferase [Leptospira brenneri]
MLYCRFCGTKEIQFRKSGKFGCTHCVSIFDYPKPKGKNKIPEPFLQTLEIFVKKNSKSITLLSLRTRITRNLKSNLFPYYDSLVEKSKQLLVDFGLEESLYPGGIPPTRLEGEKSVLGMGFYLGSEDHIRWENLIFTKEKNLGGYPSAKPKNWISIFRFLFKKPLWASAPEVGFISSCPTNLGRGRRDSLLVAVAVDVVSEFFSILRTLVDFGIEFAPSSDHRIGNIGKERVLVVKISWKNASVAQKRDFYKILGLLGSY